MYNVYVHQSDQFFESVLISLKCRIFIYEYKFIYSEGILSDSKNWSDSKRPIVFQIATKCFKGPFSISKLP